MPRDLCRNVSFAEALRVFALASSGHQGSGHIDPLHWYVACRLCIEGGFLPEQITPRPPFLVSEEGRGSARRRVLLYDPSCSRPGEMTILGGLKPKQVDVVVTAPDVGPVIAISMKGTLNAFRNLTNRLEEAGGDCTNLHLTYPSLVYAFLHVLRGNLAGRLPDSAPAALRVRSDRDRTPADQCRPNDIAIQADGSVTAMVVRYHNALAGLTQRSGIRDDVSRYEAIAMLLVRTEDAHVGEVFPGYPAPDSPLAFDQFMPTIYGQYDLRFPFRAEAPALKARLARRGWAEHSPAFDGWSAEEYSPRLHDADTEPDEADSLSAGE